MGVTVRRYMDIPIIIITLFIFFGRSILTTFLFIFKCFFSFFFNVIFVQYGKRYSKNNRDRSKIEITRIL